MNRIKSIGFSDVEIIAKNVHKLMEINKISDSHLANALGVSVMTIRRVVSGETEDPRISTISLIADYFKVSVDTLISHNEIPINITKNNKPHFVPILTWETLEQFSNRAKINLSEWQNWYPLFNNNTLKLDEAVFAIESKSSMQPRFPIGTLLIISPNEPVLDNDLILIKPKKSPGLSLRELIVDAPKWILNPIIPGSELLYFNKEEHDIVGVVVLTILHKRN